MKERPILFSGPMVRAILEGRKTVTRRACKPQPSANAHTTSANGSPMSGWWETGKDINRCPYGQPGDRLWVRESWWQAGDWQSTYPEDDTGAWFGSKRIVYSADSAPPNEPNHHYPNGLRNGSYSAAEPNKIWRHRPSIHMPRWASRILLEINAVRVERLQDISEEQSIAEGIDRVENNLGNGPAYCDYGMKNLNDTAEWFNSPIHSFCSLWTSISGRASWDANPWVWVVEFKRVTP